MINFLSLLCNNSSRLWFLPSSVSSVCCYKMTINKNMRLKNPPPLNAPSCHRAVGLELDGNLEFVELFKQCQSVNYVFFCRTRVLVSSGHRTVSGQGQKVEFVSTLNKCKNQQVSTERKNILRFSLELGLELGSGFRLVVFLLIVNVRIND